MNLKDGDHVIVEVPAVGARCGSEVGLIVAHVAGGDQLGPTLDPDLGEKRFQVVLHC
jgi:hypothetical protein